MRLASNEKNVFLRLRKDLKKYWMAYLLVTPVVLYFLIFCYKPMYGILIAFKDYSPATGILGSEWTKNYGMQHFIDFFGSYYFGRLLKNTLTISLTNLILGFPAPIIFALLLNEIRNSKFKRTVQTISYLPHFISTVVIASLVHIFVSAKGPIVSILSAFGMKKVSLLTIPDFYVPIHIISGIWQELGWSAIIYLSALAGINPELYDAASIDGANRLKQAIHVTLPGISGTIIIMLLMQLGAIMSVGSEKIILLYNENIYETADVISTFVYRKGLLEFPADKWRKQ